MNNDPLQALLNRSYEMTCDQRRALFGGIRDLLGHEATRAQRLAFATAALHRPVRSFTSITEMEASVLLDHINVSLMLRV